MARLRVLVPDLDPWPYGNFSDGLTGILVMPCIVQGDFADVAEYLLLLRDIISRSNIAPPHLR